VPIHQPVDRVGIAVLGPGKQFLSLFGFGPHGGIMAEEGGTGREGGRMTSETLITIVTLSYATKSLTTFPP
jgi:hypothetical protein